MTADRLTESERKLVEWIEWRLPATTHNIAIVGRIKRGLASGRFTEVQVRLRVEPNIYFDNGDRNG